MSSYWIGVGVGVGSGVGLGVGVAGTSVGVAVGGGTGSSAGGVWVTVGVAEGVPVGSVTAAGEQPHSTAASANASSPERILPDTAKGYLRSSGLRPGMTLSGGEKATEKQPKECGFLNWYYLMEFPECKAGPDGRKRNNL